MLQNYNKYRLLQAFFDYPLRKFQLREICREIDLSPVSVKNYLKELHEEGYVIIGKERKIFNISCK